MAIIRTAPDSYTLDALNEAVVFGPGYIDLCTDDTDAVVWQITAPTSTLDAQFQTSLDGVTWEPISTSRQKSTLGPTIQLAAATFSDICVTGHSNIPFVRFIITAYTSGSITVTRVFSRRVFTR
jgi:hypothetical protein